MSPIFMIIPLFLLISLGSSSASLVESRSLPPYDDYHHDYAVDLNIKNFDQVLRDTPASYAVVEFYAHWCPACRNYKPYYEKVAKLFNGADAVHPGIILMTRVDCAVKVNIDICDRFSVHSYPKLLWGPPSKFVSGGGDWKQEESEIRFIDNGRTADCLLNWINKQLESTYGFDDEIVENEHLQSDVSDPGQSARDVYNVEEAMSIAFDIIRNKMIKSDIRSWFSESWTSWLLSFSHPTTNVEEK